MEVSRSMIVLTACLLKSLQCPSTFAAYIRVYLTWHALIMKSERIKWQNFCHVHTHNILVCHNCEGMEFACKSILGIKWDVSLMSKVN